MTSRAITLTRFGDSAEALGFRQQCRAVYQPVSGTWNEIASLNFPYFGIALTATGTTSRVEIDAAEMAATVCGPWVLTFTELRWYVDGVEILDRFGRSVMDSSLGPYAISGDFYLQKYNQTRVMAQTEWNPAPTHGYQFCIYSETSYTIQNTASNTGGWGWYDTGTAAWIAEPITIDTLACPATTWPGGCPGSCTCSYALPSVSETDAYTITVAADRYLSMVSTYLSTQICRCRNGVDSNPINIYRNVFEYRERSSYVDGVAQSDTSLYTSKRRRLAGCTCNYPLLNDDYTISETTVTDALAYAPHQRLVSRTTFTQDCGDGYLACPEIPGGFNPPACVLISPVMCYYDCQVLQDPIETCSCTQSEPSLTHTEDGQWVATYACDTDIFTAYADQYRQPGNGLSFAYRDTGLNGSDPAIAVWTGDSEEWVLVYVDGGTVKYSISRDWGGTWSVSTSVGTGTNPRIHITADNRRIITRLDGTDIRAKFYDGAMTMVEDAGIIQSGVDASSAHDISSYSGGQGEWVALLAYVVGGSIVAKTSNDGKAYT